MSMNSIICKNCGGEKGLHHWETGQCPVNGKEAPIGKPDVWTFETFQPEEDLSEIEQLRIENKRLQRKNAEYVAEINSLERINDMAICSYCGENVVNTQGARVAHITSCENRPDAALMESLEEILSCVSVRIDDPRIKVFDKARAAIAKAKGA